MDFLRFEKQSEWIRKRYYQEMTFLDSLAKAYGELSWIKQTAISIFAISPSCFFYINPSFFLLACVLCGILILLRFHYNTLENRLKLLLEDLEYSEKEIDKLMLKNQDLEKKIMEAFEKNQITVQQLEEARVRIQLMEEACREQQQQLGSACHSLLDNTTQTTEMTAQFITVMTCSVEKSNELASTAQETLTLFQSGHDSNSEFLQSQEKINSIVEFRKAAEADLIKTFGAQYTNFSEEYDKNPKQYNPFYTS